MGGGRAASGGGRQVAGGLGVAGAVGGALLVADPLDRGPGAPPVGPLRRVARLRAERPVGVLDVVGGAVLLELPSGLPPRPLAAGGLGDGAEGLAQPAGPVLADGLVGQPGGAPLPGQLPQDSWSAAGSVPPSGS